VCTEVWSVGGEAPTERYEYLWISDVYIVDFIAFIPQEAALIGGRARTRRRETAG